MATRLDLPRDHGEPESLFLVPILGEDKTDQRPEEKQDGSLQAKRLQSYTNQYIGTWVKGLCPDGAVGLGFITGGLCPSSFGSYWNVAGPCVLTVVSVSGPTEVPEASIAQLEGGLVAFPQGCAVPQGEGSMLRTPVSNEAILLTSRKTGQEDQVTGPAWWTCSDHPVLGEQQKATMIA